MKKLILFFGFLLLLVLLPAHNSSAISISVGANFFASAPEIIINPGTPFAIIGSAEIGSTVVAIGLEIWFARELVPIIYVLARVPPARDVDVPAPFKIIGFPHLVLGYAPIRGQVYFKAGTSLPLADPPNSYTLPPLLYGNFVVLGERGVIKGVLAISIGLQLSF